MFLSVRTAARIPLPNEQKTLCVVVPCYQEEQGIQAFYAELVSVLSSLPGIAYRIVFVDDGSRDGTLGRLEGIAAGDPHVEVYSLSRNFGHQIALTAGLDVADGDAVIMMDADQQHPPQLIPRMVELWERDGFDIVSTVRESTPGASVFKRTTSRLFYWGMNRLSDTHIVPGAADFCLLSRRAHDALRSMPERHRFLRGMISWMGFPRTFVPFVAPPRAAGKSNYTLIRMVSMAANALLSFSAVPMRVVSRGGFLIVTLGVLYLVYIVGRAVVLDDLVPGWGSLIAVVLILGGLQLIGIGVIGEYLARVFEETKDRPLYFFKRTPEGGPRTPATVRDRREGVLDEKTH